MTVCLSVCLRISNFTPTSIRIAFWLKFSVTENFYIVGSGFDFDTAFSEARLRVLSYLVRNTDTP